MYTTNTGAWSTAGRWQSCDLCIQTHNAATYCGPSLPWSRINYQNEPLMQVTRVWEQFTETISWLISNDFLLCQANNNTFCFNSQVPLPFLINKLSINHVWSLFTGRSAVGRGQERLLVVLIACKQPKHSSIPLTNTHTQPPVRLLSCQRGFGGRKRTDTWNWSIKFLRFLQ